MNAETAKTEDGAANYVVWSNEHAAWWGPKHCGYYTHLSSAGRYTRSDAIGICKGARGGRAFNKNPSEVPILLHDAEQFWTEEGLEERRKREHEQLAARLYEDDEVSP
jgi:hypothetical protein